MYTYNLPKYIVVRVHSKQNTYEFTSATSDKPSNDEVYSHNVINSEVMG